MHVKRATTITLWGGAALRRGLRIEFDNGPRWRDGVEGRCLLVSWWREPRTDDIRAA